MTGKFKFIMFNLNHEMEMIIFIGPREEINQKLLGLNYKKVITNAKKPLTFVESKRGN